MIQDQQFLIDLAKMKMPFGKYKGTFLIDLPEHYIVWYRTKGFPAGKLGKQMGLVYRAAIEWTRKLSKRNSAEVLVNCRNAIGHVCNS